MKVVIPKGSTSRILTVFIQNNSVTTGAGLSGLTNASSIVGGYVREGGTGVALAVDEDVTTEGTYQAPSAVGKVRIGTPANMRAGTYELHFHNDLWATGAESVAITLGGATNMADLAIEVQLSDPVRGLGSPTALPNAAADAAGGLPISDAGGLDLDAQVGTKINSILDDTGTAGVVIAASQIQLKRNTEYTYFKFVMTDATTHAPLTGLTVTATRAIDNASFGACANSVTELANGWYKITLAAADLNGVDIALRFTATGADDRNFKIITQT